MAEQSAYLSFGTWRPYTYRQEVVGESFRYQAIEQIADRHSALDSDEVIVWAQLIPEPENRTDVNAIRVDVEGSTVGYLPAEDAEIYSSALNALLADHGGVLMVAAQIWRGETSDGRYIASVRLDLPPLHLLFPLNASPSPPAFQLPRGQPYKVIDLNDDLAKSVLAGRDEAVVWLVLTPTFNENSLRIGSYLHDGVDLTLSGQRLGTVLNKGLKTVGNVMLLADGSTVTVYARANVMRDGTTITAKVWLTSTDVMLDQFPDEMTEFYRLVKANVRPGFADWMARQGVQADAGRDSPTQESEPAATQSLPVATGTPVPADWYPDPERPGQLRYWDGVQWTGHRTQY